MNKDIKYINRDFTDFKQALIDMARSYFSDTYNDFSDASPGNMFIEMSAYVGDVLSFYTDRQLQEVLLEYAQDKSNLISLAYTLGYRPKVTSTSTVDLDVFQLVPSKISGSIASPDYDYTLIIDKESKIKSVSTGVNFITQDLVDFSFSSSADPTTISVFQLNNITNQPDYYLFKKSVKAIAGEIQEKSFNFGAPEKFTSITIEDQDIIQILDVIDSDGNKWYEVPYLAQNTIFEDLKNNSLNDPKLSVYSNQVPYVLRLKKVQRRFVARFDSENKLNLEFGAGVSTSPDEEIIPNTDNVGIGLVDSISKMNQAYDPSNFLYTKEYGLAPSNTTLTVRYLTGGGAKSIVSSNDITSIYEVSIKSTSLNPNNLNGLLLNQIKSSVAFNNVNPSFGGGDGDSVEDLRYKTMASFATQLRCVSPEDHIVRAYSLPSKFGTIAKAYVTKEDSMVKDINNPFIENNPLALNLYVLSYDSDKKLINTSYALKHNLKKYLSYYRMSNDGLNIKDAYFINIGIDFEIIVLPAFNSNEVLAKCLDSVKNMFNIDKWQIGQPIIITDIRNVIGMIDGVQSVSKVNIYNKYGEDKGYSKYGYDIQGATKNNIIYTSLDPSIFEVRFPDNDIRGRVTTI